MSSYSESIPQSNRSFCFTGRKQHRVILAHGTTQPESQRKGMARQGCNQRSADSFVRVLLACRSGLADKAVRAPGKSSPDATMLGDSTAKTQRRKGKQTVAGLVPASLLGERFSSFRFRLASLRLCVKENHPHLQFR